MKVSVAFVIWLALVLLVTGALPSSWNRIVGGTRALKGQFPYQVSVLRHDFLLYEHTCGGSIIGSRTILTAGQCIGLGPFVVGVGYIVRRKYSELIPVETEVLHPGYKINDYGDVENDVGLLILDRNLKFNQFVQPIAIETEFVTVDTAVVSGWGAFGLSSSLYSFFLRYTEVETLNTRQCKSNLEDRATPAAIENAICSTKTLAAMAIGDDGGPLVANGTQIGLVSWIVVMEPYYINVFTRVSPFAPWIREVVGNFGDNLL